ncbi:MAG: dephospho-CoA kinase, partial [Phycisphaeraceae bacterium]|nr:dephospho-CoA kinase [Phycisphaeraceae bacterium]
MTGSRRVPVIGLAGGIGAGKSAVASVLARAGCVISDSDRDAAEVLADPSVI